MLPHGKGWRLTGGRGYKLSQPVGTSIIIVDVSSMINTPSLGVFRISLGPNPPLGRVRPARAAGNAASSCPRLLHALRLIVTYLPRTVTTAIGAF